MSKDSKFSGILDAAKGRETSPETSSKATSKSSGKRSSQPADKKVEAKSTRKKPGKSRDPDYEQVTTYLQKTTHQAAKIALIQEDTGRDFSDLIEDLVADWLKK